MKYRTQVIFWILVSAMGNGLLVGCGNDLRPSFELPTIGVDSVQIDTLYMQVKENQKKKDYPVALRLAREALLYWDYATPDELPSVHIDLWKRKAMIEEKLSLIPASLNSYRSYYNLARMECLSDSLNTAHKCWASLGLSNSFSRLGMSDSAIFYAKTALDYKSLDPMQYSMCLNTLGIIYQEMADTLDNAEYFALADSCLRVVVGIRKGIPHVDLRRLGNAHLSIGDLHLDWGKLDTALHYLNIAKRIFTPYKDSLSSEMAACNSALGYYAQLKGQEDDAVEYFATAIYYATLAKKDRERGKIQIKIGDFWLAQNEGSRGLQAYHTALLQLVRDFTDTVSDHNPPLWMMEHEYHVPIALLGKAHAYEILADSSSNRKAFQCYQTAFGFTDKLRRNFASVDEKAALAEFVYPEVEHALDLAVSQYQSTHEARYLEFAFEFMERSKANELLDALDQMEFTQEYALPDSIMMEGRELSLKMDSARSRIVMGEPGGAQELVHLQDDSTQLFKWIRTHYPGYFWEEAKFLSWKEVKDQCAGEDTLIVEYFLGKNEMFVIAACGVADTAFSVPWDQSLANALTEMHRALDLREHLPLNPCFSDPAYYLFREIVKPAWNICQHSHPRRMIVVPDGNLNFISMEALLTDPAGTETNPRNLHFLLEKTTVSYAQSFQVFARLKAQSPSHPQGGVLGMGSNLKFDAGGKGLLPLNSASEEALHAVTMMGGEVALNDEATEGRFKQRAPQYGMMHVATHGLMNVDSPLRSCILFHGDDATQDDGILYAYEVYGMRLNAGLAVLSACSAGKGKVLRGSCPVTVGHSFMVAGCSNVVMTLGEVSDRRAYEIMQNFYSALAEGHTAAEALRLARLEYMRQVDSEFAHPAYWSAFILTGVGDMRFETIASEQGRMFWTLVLLFGGIGLGATIWVAVRRRRVGKA